MLQTRKPKRATEPPHIQRIDMDITTPLNLLQMEIAALVLSQQETDHLKSLQWKETLSELACKSLESNDFRESSTIIRVAKQIKLLPYTNNNNNFNKFKQHGELSVDVAASRERADEHSLMALAILTCPEYSLPKSNQDDIVLAALSLKHLGWPGDTLRRILMRPGSPEVLHLMGLKPLDSRRRKVINLLELRGLDETEISKLVMRTAEYQGRYGRHIGLIDRDMLPSKWRNIRGMSIPRGNTVSKPHDHNIDEVPYPQHPVRHQKLPPALEEMARNHWSPMLHRIRKLHPTAAQLLIDNPADIDELANWIMEPDSFIARAERISLLKMQKLDVASAVELAAIGLAGNTPLEVAAHQVWHACEIALRNHDLHIEAANQISRNCNEGTSWLSTGWLATSSHPNTSGLGRLLNKSLLPDNYHPAGMKPEECLQTEQTWDHIHQKLRTLPPHQASTGAALVLAATAKMEAYYNIKCLSRYCYREEITSHGNNHSHIELHLKPKAKAFINHHARLLGLRMKLTRFTLTHDSHIPEINGSAMSAAMSLPPIGESMWDHPDYLQCWERTLEIILPRFYS